MSTGASPDMYLMGSIGSSLSSGGNALADLAKQISQRDASRVQTFQAYVKDVPKETITDARYVGDLRPNQNRLNVFSLFTEGETDDNYRLNLKSGGNVHLSMLVDLLDDKRQVAESETATGLGIQVIQYQGSSHKVIADSDPNSGAANQLYTQLSGDGATLPAGKYVVRVYRQPDTSPHTEYSYSFQLTGDRYYQDYDTQQVEAPAHQTKSTLDFMTMDPAVSLLAANVDATMGAAMADATRPATLTTSTDSSTDPVTQLLDAFM
jgi:hypothetical protein